MCSPLSILVWKEAIYPGNMENTFCSTACMFKALSFWIRIIICYHNTKQSCLRPYSNFCKHEDIRERQMQEMPRIYCNVGLREESNFCTIGEIVSNTPCSHRQFFKSHFLHQNANYRETTEEETYCIRCDCTPTEGTLAKMKILREALSLAVTL